MSHIEPEWEQINGNFLIAVQLYFSGKMPMQKKSIERIIAFAICSIEFIIIILILCINGYNLTSVVSLKT